jgi:CDP-diacylglycerol---glycerol-3-phosphate 3-phosphatidyltransferase
MNLPNGITVARILLVPVFVVLAYTNSDTAAVASFFVFGIAGASDILDGYLARRHGTISRAGKFLDPLADKLLVGAALVVLVDTRAFPLWAALVIAVREIAVQWLRTSVVRGGGDLPASPAAKLKTLSQLSMVGWWLLPWNDQNLGHWVILAVAVGATLWSGLEYFAAAGRAEEPSRAAQHTRGAGDER